MKYMRLCLEVVLCALFLIGYALPSFAEGEDENLDVIEAEIKKSEPKIQEKKPEATVEEVKVETLSDLSKLAPFSDVSVLQRRYMPKSNRFQFFGGLAMVANDPWFWGVGFSGKVAYGLSEAWGLEATYGYNSTSEKDTIQDLFSQHAIGTDQIVTTTGYILLDAMWTPIYGKLALYNQRIVPFDMYFTFGAGTSSLGNSREASATTLHLGTGMIFALSRSMGFRWDLSINNYNATPQKAGSTAGNFNNVLLTFGVNYYIPEVRYR
jgi:outer membrane beta-barrel protein